MTESAGAAEAPDATVYRLRAHAFVGRRTYRLTDDALTWEEERKALDGVFYDAIAEIRLAYAPTRAATNRYRAQIIFREGGMAELFNLDYRGMLDFPEQNEAYVAFLRELHKRVAAAGKAVRYRQGNSMAGYIGNIALTVFIFAGLVGLFFLLMAIGATWLVVVKLALVLYFIPVLIRYIRRAKPADYDPRAIPDEVLPLVAPSVQSN
jgi:hypothetical protein